MSSVSKTRHLYCGEFARLCGVSADTVRFYERGRLLPPAARTSAGYRIFPPDSLARMFTTQAEAHRRAAANSNLESDVVLTRYANSAERN